MGIDVIVEKKFLRIQFNMVLVTFGILVRHHFFETFEPALFVFFLGDGVDDSTGCSPESSAFLFLLGDSVYRMSVYPAEMKRQKHLAE